MIGEDLLRYNKKQVYMVHDFETEGLNLHFARPWQSSWVIFTQDQILEEKDYYLWWSDVNVTKGAAFITGFDYNKYKERAVDPAKVLAEHDSHKYNKDIILLEHNGLRYDIYIHATLRRLNKQKPDFSFLNRFIDTSQLIRGHKLGFKPDRANLLAWMYKVSNVRQKGLKSNALQVGKDYGIEHDYSTLHDALSDNHLIRKIFTKKLIWEIEI
jgi:DNA polymerase III epsilon subunit-like protein